MTTSPTRTRRATHLAIALFVGVVTNLAIAWLLILSADTSDRGVVVRERAALPAGWTAWLETPVPRINATGSSYDGAGWRFSVHGIAEPLGALQVTEAGWPFLAFEGKARTVLTRVDGVLTFRLEEARGAIPCAIGPSSSFDFAGRLLPIEPRWLEFLLNTTLYATFTWLLIVMPGRWRRVSRLRRGLCPACRYPIGHATTCTECGRPLQPAAARVHPRGKRRNER